MKGIILSDEKTAQERFRIPESVVDDVAPTSPVLPEVNNDVRLEFAEHKQTVGDYQMSVNFGGARQNAPEDAAQYMLWHEDATKNDKGLIALNRAHTVDVMARTYGQSPQWVDKNLENMILSETADRSVNQTNYWEKLVAVFENAKDESKIALMRFGQLYGNDTSELTENTVRNMKITGHRDTEIDALMKKLTDDGVKGKFFLAMGGLPFFAASQAPRFIDRLKFGGTMAAAFAAAGLVGGPTTAASAGKIGFMLGGAMYGFASEAGMMYDQLLEMADRNEVVLDKQTVQLGLGIASGIIASVDMASFGNIVGRVFGKGVAKAGKEMLEDLSFRQIASGIVGKQMALAMVEEGMTEGGQEFVGDLFQNWIAKEHDSMRRYGLPQTSFEQMGENAAVVGMLAAPLAGFGAGLGASINVAWGNMRGKARTVVDKQHEIADKIPQSQVDQAVDEMGDLAETELEDMDLADVEVTSDPVADMPGEPITQVEEVSPAEAPEGLEVVEAKEEMAQMESDLEFSQERLVEAEQELATVTTDEDGYIENAPIIESKSGTQLHLEKVTEQNGENLYEIRDRETGQTFEGTAEEIGMRLYGEMNPNVEKALKIKASILAKKINVNLTPRQLAEAHVKAGSILDVLGNKAKVLGSAGTESWMSFKDLAKVWDVSKAQAQAAVLYRFNELLSAQVEERTSGPVRKMVLPLEVETELDMGVGDFRQFYQPGKKVGGMIVKDFDYSQFDSNTIANVWYQEFENGPVKKVSFDEFVAMSGKNPSYLKGRIKSAADGGIADVMTIDHLLAGKRTDQEGVQALGEMMALEGQKKGLVFRLTAASMAVVTDEKTAAIMKASGDKFIGYYDDGIFKYTGLSEGVRFMGYERFLKVNEEFSAPAGVAVHREVAEDGTESFYYFEGDIDDTRQSVGQQVRALQDEQALGEEESMTPVGDPDEEAQIAGGQEGVVEVANHLEAIDQKNVGRRYAPKDERGLPYLWKLHGRVSFRNKLIWSARDIAQMFSVFRHPNIEHAHVIYMNARGHILANTCESSGTAAAAYIDPDAIANNVRALGATQFYIVHNHPSGNVKESTGDTQYVAMLEEDYPGIFKGSIIMNHDQYGITEPGGKQKYQPYRPKTRYDKPPEHRYTTEDVADEINNRGTAIFIMSGEKRIRAVLTPNRLMSGDELYALTKHYGGSFYNIASDDTATRKHYTELGGQIQGTAFAQMGLVMSVKSDGSMEIDYTGALTGDKSTVAGKSQTLWEEEDPTPDTPLPIPKTVKGWRGLWEQIVAAFNIQRPSGIYPRITRTVSTKNLKTGKSTVEAQYVHTEEGTVMEVKVQDVLGESPAVTARYEVVQDPKGGLGVGIITEEDVELSAEETRMLDDAAKDMVNEIFDEGTAYNTDDLDISDQAKEAIDDYDANKTKWFYGPIAEALEGSSLKEKLLILSDELQTLDRDGKSDTKEFNVLQTVAWRMAQNYVELEGMTSKGILRVKKLASDLFHSKYSPGKLKKQIEEKVQEEYDVRLPLTKKQGKEWDKLKDVPLDKLSQKERRFVEWVQKPGIESLSYEQLAELKHSLELYWKLRYATTKVFFGGKYVPLKKGIEEVRNEFVDYNPDVADELTPAEARKNRTLKRVKNFARNFIVHRQMQFFRLVEHIAGPSSMAHQLLFRNLEDGARKALELRFALQDAYGAKLHALGVDGLESAKWSDEEISVGGTTLSNGQALEIYLHSLAEDNWSAITNKGMRFSGKDNTRHELLPDQTDFQAIADHIAADPMGKALAVAVRQMYDVLGRHVKNTYEALFGREWTYEANYYPKKVAREVFQQGQDELSNVEIKDGDGVRITLAKSFNIDRTFGDAPLELNINGFSGTVALSLEQETKFVHMEQPMFQASKLIYDPDFKAQIVNTKSMGEGYWKLLESGLQDWAGRHVDITRTWDRVLLGVRRQATRAALGFNPFSAAKAAISWGYALQFLDPRSASVGLSRVNAETMRELLMKSPVFRDRVIGGALPEINDILKGDAAKFAAQGFPSKGTKSADEAMFWMLRHIDKRTVAAVMEGGIFQATEAFEQGKMTDSMIQALGFNESTLKLMSLEDQTEAAIKYGEWILQRTQPDFRPESRNAFQRGTPIERLASVFGSFVTITHNMAWDMVHQIKHEGLGAIKSQQMIYTMALMALVMAGNEGTDALKKLLLKREQSTLWDMLSRAIFNNTFIVRDLNEMVLSKLKYGAFAGKGGSDSYLRLTDMLVTGAILSIDGMMEDNTDDLLAGVTSMVEGMGMLTGLPTVAAGYLITTADKRVINK